MEERVPKYYALKRKVIRKIEMGEYPEDTPILSERELMELYQVSRITVRRAIDISREIPPVRICFPLPAARRMCCVWGRRPAAEFFRQTV